MTRTVLVALGAAGLALLACSSDDAPSGPPQPDTPDAAGPSPAPGPAPVAPGVDTPPPPAPLATAAWAVSYPVFDGNVSAVASRAGELVVSGTWRDPRSPFDQSQVNPGTGVDDAVTWIAKIDRAGALAWAKSFVSTPANGGGISRMSIAPDGSIYVVGRADKPLALGAVNVPKGGFVARFGADGVATWAHSFAEPTSSDDVFARDVGADAEGAWVALTLKGSATMDGSSLPVQVPGELAEVVLLRFAPAGALVPSRSFVATKGSVQNAQLSPRANGDFALAGSPLSKELRLGSKPVTVPDSSGLFNSTVFWSMFPGGSEPRWSRAENLDIARVRFALSGGGVAAFEFQAGAAGNPFINRNGITVLGLKEADGARAWAHAYPKAASSKASMDPDIGGVDATSTAVAMWGKCAGCDIDFGGGVISNSGFAYWASADGTPLRSVALPYDSVAALDDEGNLLAAGEASPATTIGGRNVNGFFFVKLAK